MNPYADIFNMKRARSTRPAMAEADRAKIFAPFSALKGLEEASRRMEGALSPRPEVAEDRAQMLDRRLRALRPGDRVTVTYFKALCREGDRELGELERLSGTVEATDAASGVLRLDSGCVETRDVVDVGRR